IVSVQTTEFRPAGRIPETDAAVVVRRRQRLVVGTESHGMHRRLVTAESANLAFARRVPQDDSSIAASGDELLAIARECHTRDPVGVAQKSSLLRRPGCCADALGRLGADRRWANREHVRHGVLLLNRAGGWTTVIMSAAARRCKDARRGLPVWHG